MWISIGTYPEKTCDGGNVYCLILFLGIYSVYYDCISTQPWDHEKKYCINCLGLPHTGYRPVVRILHRMTTFLVCYVLGDLEELQTDWCCLCHT